MQDFTVYFLLIHLGLVAGCLYVLYRKLVASAFGSSRDVIMGCERVVEPVQKELQRIEKSIRDEFPTLRKEISDNSSNLRAETGAALKNSSDSVSQTVESLRKSVADNHDAVRSALDARLESFEKAFSASTNGLKSDTQKSAEQLQRLVTEQLKDFRDSILRSQHELIKGQKDQHESVTRVIQGLAQANEDRLGKMRETIEKKMNELQTANDKKLEEMRVTVDEKLQGTLEKRLGESFKLVSERLEQVQKGLGEMQSLAIGVGDLKKVLSNVKSRGIWAEYQLAALLEDMLTPDQYAINTQIRPRSAERVEFAIRLPGKDEGETPVLLPIDSKFPREDYERLIQAQEAGDSVAAAQAALALESEIRRCARDIQQKYIHPPYSTDFAILYLPFESLFAEVLRRPGLVESLQQEFRVTIAGPTTLSALLNSLQMGFRTLAVQKRSSEVWKILGAVKSEFGKFGETLDRLSKQLDTAQRSLGDATSRTRQIQSKLRTVEEVSALDAVSLLALGHISTGDPQE